MYEVRISAQAARDIDDYASYILLQEKAEPPAERWISGLQEQIESLETMPRRFRAIDDPHRFDMEIRQTVYHSHLVFYSVSDDPAEVIVLRVYPASQMSSRTRFLDPKSF
ncbi:MAG: type II toxin-antitoxin system RelE/ParE family toxin [Armatimonadetes bacterium]|nr:type II toxin-antitoxin system RelE/ParE family toxin [Armatimonadota bacterium]